MQAEIKNDTSYRVFDSAADMIAVADHRSDECSSFCELMAKRAGFTEFHGRRDVKTFAQFVSKANANWDRGLQVIERMREQLAGVALPTPVDRKRRSRWDEFDGDEICNDRLRGGQQFWRQMERREIDAPKVVTINSDVCAASSVDPDNILWRGAAAIVVTEILEAAGYSVELWFSSEVVNNENTGADADNAFTAVLAKAAGASVDVSSIVNLCSGWWFRILTLATYSLNKDYVLNDRGTGMVVTQSRGKGFAEYVRPESTGPILTIDACFSFTAAVDKARELLTQFAAV